MARLTRLVLALVLLTPGIGGTCAAAAPQSPRMPADAAQHERFAAFWPRFRDALLAGQTAQLSQMTHFPLAVHGTLDSDPVSHISPAQLPGLLAEILAADSGLSVTKPETNRDLIKRLPRAESNLRGVSVSADAARVGPFGFARQQNKWQLVKLYRDDDE